MVLQLSHLEQSVQFNCFPGPQTKLPQCIRVQGEGITKYEMQQPGPRSQMLMRCIIGKVLCHPPDGERKMIEM